MFGQRGETDFFSGDPLRALSTLVFSDNVDLQRSASLTFAEITERGTFAERRLGREWEICQFGSLLKPEAYMRREALLTTHQMYAKSTAILSSLSCSSSRAQTLKCREPPALLWATLQ